MGVQAATVNLKPSQPKSSHLNSMIGTVIATTNYNNSTTSSDSISVHDGNSDSHSLQTILDLIVNNMASMQSQLIHVNSVIDQENTSKTSSGQHSTHSDLGQPGVPAQGVYDYYCMENTQHNMTHLRALAPQTFPFPPDFS